MCREVKKENVSKGDKENNVWKGSIGHGPINHIFVFLSGVVHELFSPFISLRVPLTVLRLFPLPFIFSFLLVQASLSTPLRPSAALSPVPLMSMSLVCESVLFLKFPLFYE